MDAEHRHELKRNELAEALSHLKEWRDIDQRTLLAIGGVIILILLWIAVRTWSWAAEQSQFNSWADYQSISRAPGPDGSYPLDAIRKAAAGEMSGAVQPLAQMELAEALCFNAALDPANSEPMLTEAMTNIESAISKVSTLPSSSLYVAALITKARIHESQGDFAAARGIYETLQDERFAGSPFTTPLGVGTSFEQPALAAFRLDTLADLESPLTLTPGLDPANIDLTTVPSVPNLESLGSLTELESDTRALNAPAASNEVPTDIDADQPAEEPAAP